MKINWDIEVMPPLKIDNDFLFTCRRVLTQSSDSLAEHCILDMHVTTYISQNKVATILPMTFPCLKMKNVLEKKMHLNHQPQ